MNDSDYAYLKARAIAMAQRPSSSLNEAEREQVMRDIATVLTEARRRIGLQHDRDGNPKSE